MQSIKKTLRNLSVRWVLLFLIGGAIQIGPAVVLLFDLTGNIMVQKLSQTQTYVLTIGVFVIGIFYCVFASLAFTPKKFFTPTSLHLATWSFLSAVLLAAIIVVNSPNYLPLGTILSAWITDTLLAAVLLAIVAVGQFFLVRFFVGRNGMATDAICIGFQVLLPFKQVLEKVESVGDHPYLGWLKHKKGTHHTFKIWIAGSNYTLLIIAANLKDEQKTLVAMANFDLFWTTIAKSPYAEEPLETIKTHLLKVLKCQSIPLEDDRILRIAEEEALEPTRPWSISWARMNTDVRRLLGALGALVVGMVTLWMLKILTDPLFYEFIIFLTLDMVFVGVPAISEKIGESRTKT